MATISYFRHLKLHICWGHPITLHCLVVHSPKCVKWSGALKQLHRCSAAEIGRHVQVLLRKGGMREPVFSPRANTFLLFPTGFHTDEGLVKAGSASPYEGTIDWDPKQQLEVPIKSVAQV
jgi:hypothetical protein